MRSSVLEGGMSWAAWLRTPRRVGAVMPSSVRLAAAMAREVPAGRGLAVELDCGTGSITAREPPTCGAAALATAADRS